MSSSASERRRVYLACRAIFAGNNAQLRKQKKIKEVIKKKQAYLAPLIRDIGFENVVEVSRILLEDGVFESDLKAKRTESEHNAARSAAEALEEMMSNGDLEVNDDEAKDDGVAKTVVEIEDAHEECFFEFGQHWLSSFLDEKGWDCSEAVELTKWTRVLIKRSEKLPAQAFKFTEKSLSTILLATRDIRHTVVHRLPTPARSIINLVNAAVACPEALQDHKRAAQLEELCAETRAKAEAMELNKNAVEGRLNQELAEIPKRRDELARLEKSVVDNVNEDDASQKQF
ncbi:hypothetical protein LTR22_025801 [Elasticomyces elasticus]|nr:hypothetical protein LTR22_025801 [Elasticomyces elasticus]